MPHYADGTAAQIGDKVIGKPYNTPQEVIGEVVQITPGTESCNLVVAFAELVPLTQEEATAMGKARIPEPVFGSNEQKYSLIRGR